MAALEHRILTKILKQGSMIEALRTGLQTEHFKDPEARKIFKFLLQHWYDSNTSRTVPSIATIKRRWPSFSPTAVYDDEESELRAMIQEQRVLGFETDIRSLANHFQELVEIDPKEALDAVQKGVLKIRSLMENKGRHLDISGMANSALEHYKSAKTGSLYGIPWPWEPMTEDTMGKRAGDLVVFYGRMKSMKTWIMLHCAAEDYLNGYRVLIWSKEMSQDKISLRLASLLAKVDYQLFKKGRLPPKLERRALHYLNELRNLTPDMSDGLHSVTGKDFMLLCGRDAPPTLESLQSKIEEFCPHIVYEDSFYHMESARTVKLNQRWQKVACLTEDQKGAAEEYRIPFVLVAQANRLGEKTSGNTLADVADADVIGREGDLVVRVMKKRGRELHEEDYEVAPKGSVKPSKGMPKIKSKCMGSVPKKVEQAEQEEEGAVRYGAEVALMFGGNREGVLEGLKIHAIPGYNFSLIETNYSADDARKWMSSEGMPSTGAQPPSYGPTNPKFGK